MSANDVVVQLVLKAVDLATKDIDGVHDKLEDLKTVLTGNEFSRSAEGMQSFGQAVKDSTEPLATAAKNTLALSAAVTGVASYLAGNAYKAAKDYESALTDLAKVLDGGKEEAKAYGEQLNELALRYGQNGQQLVAAMANFVQAGYNGKEAFDLVEQSVKLMIAGEIEAGQSSEYLISILKGFKASASEAASTVDLLNEVSNKYATDVKQLAIGMAAISPIAKQMGFSMSETAGMLTPIIEVYGSGAEAADALKTGLQKLTDSAAPTASALSMIGVSQLDVNGKLRQGKDIFIDVAKAMVGLDDAQKQYVIGQLVGIEQAGRMAQVFDNLAGYLGATDAALNSTGSAMKEVEARLETAEAKGKKAEESFRQLSVTLGNTFKPQIAGVIGATGDLAAAFDKAVKSGDLAPLLNVIKPQIAAVENLFSAMAANLDQALDGVDWTPLVDGIKAFSSEFGQAMGALTDGMDLSTVEGLRNLLQALINLMGNFSQYVAGVVDGLEPFLDSLNVLFKAVSTNLPTFSNLAGQITGLATSANQVIPVITTLGGTIFGAIGSVIELAAKIGLLVGGLKLLSAVGIPVGEILGGLVTRFLALNPAVAGVIASLAGLPGLVAGLTAAAGGLGYALGTVVNKTVEWATGGQSIGTMLYDLVNGSTDAEQAINRVATAEEKAAAAAKIRAAAERDKQEAERKAAEASAATIKANEDKIAKNNEETETIERLKKKYAEMGLVWDQVTGEITHQNALSAEQKRAALELGTALDKLGVDAGVMAERMTQAGQDLLNQLNGIASNAQATSKEVNAAILAMIPKMETQAELEALRKKIEEFGKSGKLTGDQVADGLALIQDRIRNLVKDPAFDLLADNLAKAREETDRGTEAMERWQTKASAQTQAVLALAKARGDEAAAAYAVAQAAEQELEFSKEKIEQLRAQNTEIATHILQLTAQAMADGKVTDEERKVIEALTDKSAAIDLDIAKLTAHLPLQEREAQQAAIMAGPIGDLARLYADQAKEHQRAADVSEQYYSVQLKEIEGAIKVAQAKGDENAVMALQVKQQKILIDQAEALAAAKATEAADAQKAVDAKKLELAADGELSKADQEQITNLEAVAKQKQAAAQEANLHAEALQKEADALKNVNDGAKAFDNAAQNAYKFSDAAADVDRRNKEVSESAEKVKNAMEGVNAAMAKFRDKSVVSFGTQGGKEFELVVNDIKRAIEEAVTAADRLANEGLRGVGVNAADAALYAENLATSLEQSESYLNDAARAASENLRQALADARAEAEAMVQSLAEAADATEKEILRLQGKNKEILDIEHAEKLRQLEEEYKKAGELGDAEYRRARAAEEALHDLKMRQLKEQADPRKTESTTGAAGTSNTSNTGITAPTKTYQLNLVGEGGKRLNATTDADPSVFLDALESARRRSILS